MICSVQIMLASPFETGRGISKINEILNYESSEIIFQFSENCTTVTQVLAFEK